MWNSDDVKLSELEDAATLKAFAYGLLLDYDLRFSQSSDGCYELETPESPPSPSAPAFSFVLPTTIQNKNNITSSCEPEKKPTFTTETAAFWTSPCSRRPRNVSLQSRNPDPFTTATGLSIPNKNFFGYSSSTRILRKDSKRAHRRRRRHHPRHHPRHPPRHLPPSESSATLGSTPAHNTLVPAPRPRLSTNISRL